MKLLILSWFLAAPIQSGATTIRVVLKSDSPVVSGRALLEETAAKKTKSPLVLMKFHADRREFAQCLKFSAAALKGNAVIAPWIQEQRLRCASEISDVPALESALTQLEKKSDWYLTGPAAGPLRRSTAQAWLKVIEHHLTKDRTLASRYLEKALGRLEWFDASSRSQLFRLAGENSFLQQRLRAAETFFVRSLAEKEEPEVRRRLTTVRTLLPKIPSVTEPGVASSAEARVAIEVSEKEKEIADRMSASLKNSDAVAAIEDGVELIRLFPGGQRARWATDRIFEAYSSVADKTDPKFGPLQQRVLELMDDVDGPRLVAWMERAFRLGFYGDVAKLSGVAVRKTSGTLLSTRALALGASSHLFTGNPAEARKMYQELTERHFGTPEAVNAFFRIALLDFKKGDFASAVSYLERLLILPDSSNFELNARYWLWRSLQKMNSPRAEEEAKLIVERYPFSYYGLRARSERDSGFVSVDGNNEVFEAGIEMTKTEHEAWTRAQVLMKNAWFEAAQSELSVIPEPADSVGRALWARVWASAMGLSRGLKLIGTAWENDPRLRNETFLRSMFPQEYEGTIKKTAARFGLDPLVVRSLIRQESSFELKAISSSGALGLMQLMPFTAQECAQDLKQKLKKVPEDVFVPDTNILFGTHYLNKMLQRFGQNLPWALAAYNAGPERLNRWARGRELLPISSSDPAYEMWIDELPWTETQIYVKSILRNILLYRILDKGRVPIAEPIWRTENPPGQS